MRLRIGGAILRAAALLHRDPETAGMLRGLSGELVRLDAGRPGRPRNPAVLPPRS